jgi:MFS transporter, DHA1 family, multidrug resistance protein
VTAGTVPAAPPWRRTLWLMVALQAMMATAFGMAAPFMPFFLVQLGVAPMAQVVLWTGTISAVGALVLALGSPFWGAYADRHGRKATVVRCCVVPALCFAMIGFCQHAWQVVAVYALSGLFGGFSASAMALAATQSPEDRLGSTLGWMATGQLGGSLAGPLVGGLLADRVHDYHLIFLMMAAGMLLGTLLITTPLHERFERPAAAERTPFRRQVGEVVRHPTLLPLLFVLFLAQVTIYAAIPIIPLYVRALIGDVPYLRTAAGAAIAIAGIAGVIATPLLGRLGDRIGYRRVLAGSLACAALFTFPQALIGNAGAFLALRFGAGLFVGGILPATNALIGRVFPREQRGRIYGITSSASYLGLAGGPAAGGLVGGELGFSAVFVVVGALLLVILALVTLGPQRRT